MFNGSGSLNNLLNININELKEIQLQILKHTASFCDAHDIQYWIDNGTLLGAVRHKGYIPWDDDIDVGMLRDDYEKMIRLFNEENDRYFFACYETKKDFNLPHGKVFDTDTVLYEPDENGFRMCVNIDIFVYDNAPDDPEALKHQFDRRDFYRRMYDYQHYNNFANVSVIKKSLAKMLVFLLKVFPQDYFIKKMIENCKKHNDEDSAEVGNFSSFSRQHCNKRVFSRFVELEFEGMFFKAPAGYDEWLRSFYSDYMQLPPEEKRVSHHSFVAYRVL